MYKLNYKTKEQLLKENKVDDLFMEPTNENLKKQGFDSMYDIIERPDDALKAVGDRPIDIFLFFMGVGPCLQTARVLPVIFDYRLIFTEDTINMIREAIEKDKLEVLSKDEDSDESCSTEDSEQVDIEKLLEEWIESNAISESASQFMKNVEKNREDVDEVGDYCFTKEYKLKGCIMDGRLWIEEDVHQNLKNAGFKTLYDIIQNPKGVLEAISTNKKEDVARFRRTVCICLQTFGLLPLHFCPRFVFTKCVINRIRKAIEKDKLGNLCDYKNSNRSYTREDLEGELEWFTVEDHLKRLDIESIYLDEPLYQKLKNAGFNNLYDLVENLNVALEVIGGNEEEIKDLRCDMWFALRSVNALPEDYEKELVFTEDAIGRVKASYRKNFFEKND